MFRRNHKIQEKIEVWRFQPESSNSIQAYDIFKRVISFHPDLLLVELLLLRTSDSCNQSQSFQMKIVDNGFGNVFFTWREGENELEVKGVELGEEEDEDDAENSQPPFQR
jgi:hypothetical protein